MILQPDLEDFQAAREYLLHAPRLVLRGPDALHLAVAKRYGETLYTLDRQLLECATALGVGATDAGLLKSPLG